MQAWDIAADILRCRKDRRHFTWPPRIGMQVQEPLLTWMSAEQTDLSGVVATLLEEGADGNAVDEVRFSHQI